jgi:hypothetical protein
MLKDDVLKVEKQVILLLLVIEVMILLFIIILSNIHDIFNRQMLRNKKFSIE